jgi:DnaK suppressor protein
MDRSVIEICRTELQRQLDETMAEAERTVADMTTVEEENFPDPTDRALLESNRNFMLRLRDRDRKLVTKLQQAIKRIETGTFGTCEACGGEIEEKRLVARPVTSLCFDCKTEEEEEEVR